MSEDRNRIADDEALLLAREAAIKAGDYLSGVATTGTRVVSDRAKDIKTLADTESESLIRAILAPSMFPVLGEEQGGEVDWHSCPACWIVDPLDGTANFTRGFPIQAVSIALWHEGRAILGVINDFVRKECYYGSRRDSAFLNGNALLTSDVGFLEQAILATGFPVGRSYERKSLETFISSVSHFKKVRMLGSAAMSLAYVARGVFDVYWEQDIMIWDVAAGIALVESAGGEVCLESGTKPNQCNVVATNGSIGVADVVEAISER